MSLVYAGVVPDAAELRGSSHSVMEEVRDLEGELYQSKPDAIIVLSSADAIHGRDTILLGEQFTAGERTVPGNLSLSTTMKRSADRSGVDYPLEMVAEEVLPSPIATALEFVGGNLDKTPVIPFLTGVDRPERVHELMEVIHNRVAEHDARFAVLATGVVASSTPEQAAAVARLQEVLLTIGSPGTVQLPAGLEGTLVHPLQHLVALLYHYEVGADVYAGEPYDGHTAVVAAFPVQ